MTMKQHPPLMGRHSSPGQLQSGLQLAQGLTWPKTEHVLCKKTSLLGQHSSFPFPPLMGFLAAAFNWVLFWLLLLWHGPSPFLFEFTGRQATKKHWSVFKVVPTCHRVTPCDTANHWAPEHWKKNPAKKIWSNEGYQAYTWNQMLGHHVCNFHDAGYWLMQVST